MWEKNIVYPNLEESVNLVFKDKEWIIEMFRYSNKKFSVLINYTFSFCLIFYP